MAGYNWVDYILLGVFFVTAMSGLVRGGAKEVVSVLSWVVAYFVAGIFTTPVANYFASSSQVQDAMATTGAVIGAAQVSNVTMIMVFCALFFGTLIIGSIVGSIVGHIVESFGLGIVNRLVGGLVGLGKGYLMNVIIIFLVQLTSFATQPAWSGSVVVNSMQPTVEWFTNLVAPGVESLKTKMQNLNSGLQDSVSKVFQSQ